MNARLPIQLILTLALASSALAQSSGGPYALDPHAIANGGGRSNSGVFDLQGTIGQHDAGSRQSGGAFEHTGGLRRAAAGAVANDLFHDGFE
jgi:hypothetical protein